MPDMATQGLKKVIVVPTPVLGFKGFGANSNSK
jgi:hypothetical protein